MKTKQYFSGSIIIGDPSYFVNSEEDWEKCEYGKNMDRLGFTDFLFVEFPDDPQVVVDNSNKIIGGICQDSGVIVIVYLNELEKYNPNYLEAFYSDNNRTIIRNYKGEVGFKAVPVNVDGYDDKDTVIWGNGNVAFQSCYEEDF